MTIYLEKNKQGEPTGVWIVEIRKMTGGVSKTIRQRTRDYSEAKRLEASLRGSAGRPARLPVAVQAPSFTTRLPAPCPGFQHRKRFRQRNRLPWNRSDGYECPPLRLPSYQRLTGKGRELFQIVAELRRQIATHGRGVICGGWQPMTPVPGASQYLSGIVADQRNTTQEKLVLHAVRAGAHSPGVTFLPQDPNNFSKSSVFRFGFLRAIRRAIALP
jgi:hypothetical protein